MESLNAPNFLTFIRMIASFGVLVYGLQNRWEIAFPIFCLAAFTDMIDGTVARILGQRTRLGGFLDPTADKLLMFFSFLALTKGGYIPVPITGLVIARDLFISVGLAILKSRKAPIVYRPTYLSKATTFFQITTILAALLTTQKFALPFDLRNGLIWNLILATTTVLTAATGVQYFRIGWNMLHSKS